MLRHSGAALFGAAILSLTACGGGSAPPVVVTATADSATVSWNAPTSINVLKNDSASSGVLALSAVSSAAHGTAAVIDGAVQYTPDAGYFGPDSLTYTVTANDGTTASAPLGLTVIAKMTVSGVVTDSPLANAAVTATVGTQTFSATADANGKYSIGITTSTSTDLVVVTALGSGAQSQVKLRSVLGDALALAKLAKSDGSLGSDQLASTNVTNVSTVLAALVEEANAGQTPATLAQFGALTTGASMSRLTNASVAIKLVADQGIALPTGVADTEALVAQPSTSSVLADFLSTQQSNGNDKFILAEDAFLSVSALPAAAANGATLPGKTLVYFAGYRTAGLFSLQVTYAADGTAQVIAPDGPHAAVWSQSGGVLTLTLAEPSKSTTTANNPFTNQIQPALGQTTGYQISQLAGAPSGGIAMVLMQGTWTLQSAPNQGLVVPYAPSLAANVTAVVDVATVPPLAASDFEAGTQWAGLIVGQGANDVSQGDVLSITGAATGSYARVGGQVTWSVNGGLLKIVGNGVEYDYRRLVAAAPTGEEQWLATTLQGGAIVDVEIQMVAKVTTGLMFVAGNSFAERWQSGVADYVFLDLNSGLFGTEVVAEPEDPPQFIPLSWAVNADGTLSIAQTSNGTATSQREWTLMSKQAGSILVMEHLDASDSWRLNIYADLGIAPVSSIPAPTSLAPVPSAPAPISVPPVPSVPAPIAPPPASSSPASGPG